MGVFRWCFRPATRKQLSHVGGGCLLLPAGSAFADRYFVLTAAHVVNSILRDNLQLGVAFDSGECAPVAVVEAGEDVEDAAEADWVLWPSDARRFRRYVRHCP